MKSFKMDKEEIKQAAISFKQALLNWKSEEKIRESSKINHPDWGEVDILKCVEYETEIVKPILIFLEPIYRLAIRNEIERPYHFYNAYVARTMNDHLGWPETLYPYWRFIVSIQGGLSVDVINELYSYNDYKNLEKYIEVVKEIESEGWTHKTDP